MAEFKHGSITLVVEDALTPSPEAGQMDPAAVKRIPKVPHGMGKTCEDAADSIEKAGDKFAPPKDVTAASLREAGDKAERIDQVVHDIEVMLVMFKQASLIFKATAYEQVRKVNDLVRAQGKHNEELLTIFEPLTSFFSRLRRRKIVYIPVPTAETKEA